MGRAEGVVTADVLVLSSSLKPGLSSRTTHSAYLPAERTETKICLPGGENLSALEIKLSKSGRARHVRQRDDCRGRKIGLDFYFRRADS